MKKIIILSLAFCAMALLPQVAAAQTQPAPSKEKKTIVTSKGEVVPVNKTKVVKKKPMGKDQKVIVKEEKKMHKTIQKGKAKGKTIPMVVTPKKDGLNKQTKLAKQKKMEKQ